MSILGCFSAFARVAAQAEHKPAPRIPPELPDPKAVAASAARPDGATRVAERLALEREPIPLPDGLVDWSRVHLEEPGDGRVWARGRTFKASFGAEGATYIPFLDSRAPRNLPVHVGVGTHAASDPAIDLTVSDVTLRGDTVVLDRGAFLEVWHLGLASAEQTFEFDTRPTSTGDFTIRVALDTELALRADGDGFALDGVHGGVRIGHATAIDADSRRLDLVSRADGREIALVLPASYLDSVRYPLIVDPVYSTAALDGYTEECLLPDVAGGDGTGGFAAVYTIYFSASDSDVHTMNLLFGTPDFGSGVWVDTTAHSWHTARVAYNALHPHVLERGERDPRAPDECIRGSVVSRALRADVEPVESELRPPRARRGRQSCRRRRRSVVDRTDVLPGRLGEELLVRLRFRHPRALDRLLRDTDRRDDRPRDFGRLRLTSARLGDERASAHADPALERGL